MDRRRTALSLLLAFVACTGAAILFSGFGPVSDTDVVPWLVQVAGYLCGIAGGVLLLTADEDEEGRRIGRFLMAAFVALVLADAYALTTDSGGVNIGAGLVRLLLLVGIAVLTARLARAVAADRGPR